MSVELDSLNIVTASLAQVHELLASCGLSSTAPWLVGRCPMCGGTYALGVKLSDAKGRAIWHSVPQCEKVASLPPLGFLQWARTEGGAGLQRRGGDPALLQTP